MPTHAHHPANPADLLRMSAKFIQWKPPAPAGVPDEPQVEVSHAMGEQHYTPADLAKIWGVSVQTIRELFKEEEGVLKIGSDGNRNRRAYKTLRIPHSVAERVHTRLSA